ESRFAQPQRGLRRRRRSSCRDAAAPRPCRPRTRSKCFSRKGAPAQEPAMHIAPYDNRNEPVVDIDDEDVPLVYFNRIVLRRNESFPSAVPGYETCIVPAHGTIDVTVARPDVDPETFAAVGVRASVWDKDPSAVYVPVGATARMVCLTDDAEIFVGGARCE